MLLFKFEKCFTMMYMLCIAVMLGGVGVGHEQKENVSFTKKVGSYG